jgi:glycosyltransferase involved in cell wall biosynthesis
LDGFTSSGAPEEFLVSVVVPCYNEEAGIAEFHKRLSSVMASLGCNWEVVYVNDGSTDQTLRALETIHGLVPTAAVLNLSRNFGKEIALTAGLDHARGDAVVIIDADLQDPPELIPTLVFAWRDGWDMVYAQRRTRDGETWLKKFTADSFYRVMEHLGSKVILPRNTGDFRLISRRALNALLKMREHHRFMKGMFAWVGFPSRSVLYDRAPRYAGGTSWNYWKLWNFALEGITGFTVAPLKIATYAGGLVAGAAIVYGCTMIIRTILFGNPVPGYPSLIVIILFLGGVQLITLGLMGEYIGRIFNEAKNRPLYFLERYLPTELGSTNKNEIPTDDEVFLNANADRSYIDTKRRDGPSLI